MTAKELRHLSRAELLQILLTQVEKNEKLQAELDNVSKQLENKTVMCDNVGSLAEASLQLNGIFEAADRAAQEYLAGIRNMNAMQEEIAADAMRKAERIISDADAYKAARIQEADEYWDQVRTKVSKLMEEQQAFYTSVQSGERKK